MWVSTLWQQLEQLSLDKAQHAPLYGIQSEKFHVQKKKKKKSPISHLINRG
jgi:hypothetical protein